MAYSVYILQSDQDDSYDIGQTRNMDERLECHNRGRSRYMKGKLPWRLVYHEVFETRSQATQREKEIKGKKDRSYIARLLRASR